MSIPIIIYHIGDQEYVNLVVEQAEEYNKVILIGDDSNKDFCKHHYNYKNIQSQYNIDFNKLYKHISTNSEMFEKNCIERWIYILYVMDKEHIEKAFICDSDVLIYANIYNIVNTHFTNELYYLTTHNKELSNISQSIWSIEKLREFVQFINFFYKNSNFKYIYSYWDTYIDKIHTGINDMYLLYCFLTKSNFAQNHFDLKPNILLEKYDLNISCPVLFDNIHNLYGGFFNSIDINSHSLGIQNWRAEQKNVIISNMKKNKKQITRQANNFFCLDMKGQAYKIISMHFNGSKQLIKQNINKCEKITSCNKLFFIGLNKTGTTSINSLFNKKSYRSTHNGYWWSFTLDRSSFHRANKNIINDISHFINHQIFTDGVEYILGNKEKLPELNKLDNLFPNSKFVYTTRKLKLWLVSRLNEDIQRYYFNMGIYDNINNILLKWVNVRNNWYTQILSHFKERPNDLLIIDYTDPLDNPIKKLSTFLNIDLGTIPEHQNKSKNKNIQEKRDNYTKIVETFLDKYIVKDDWNSKFEVKFK